MGTSHPFPAQVFDPTAGDVAQCAFARGAALCVARRSLVVYAFADVVRSSKCTHLTTTPRLLATLVDEPRDRRGASLRVAAVGGEAPSPRLVRAFGGRGGGFALRVVYGVTECCVYQCGREVASREPIAEVGDVGAPLAPLTTVAIADGEVLLGGPLVEGARYLGDAAATARAYGERGGRRFYRTGDGGALVAGSLALGGRLDDQIKISGRRVELGDLDAQVAAALGPLATHVRCAALPGGDAGVAAVCETGAAARADPAVDGVLSALALAVCARRLPRYAVPRAVLFGSRLPRTATDKLDRRRCGALAAAALADRRAPTGRAPRTRAERAVVDAFAEVGLGGGRSRALRVDDSFATLGGDSLAAVRVARRLEARLARGKDFLGREEVSSNDAFDPRKLVAAPSVRAYAASLAAAVGDGDDAADDDVEAAAPGTADDVLEDDARDDDVEAAAPGTADDVLEDAVSQALEDALSVAAERGNVAAVEALVAAFGRLDDGRERRAKRVTPLARAAAAGQAAAAGALVRSGARPTAVDELGRAPLHRAAAGLDAGHAACVDVLLDAGAPLALRDRAEQSALHAAARSGSAAATRALLRRDGAAACANWLDRWGRPPLAWVALRDDDDESLAVADALLRGGADPSPPVLRPGVLRRKTNLAPESPLAIADRRGKTALVALLTAAAAATPPRPPK